MHSVQTSLYLCASRADLIQDGHRGGIPPMRRKVESLPKASPVDAHERTRDYLSEEEFALLLQGTPHSRYRWRNAAMLMLTFYHGLRVTELCRLRRQDVDLTHGRIWIQRLKGSLSTEQPLHPDELRTLNPTATLEGIAQNCPRRITILRSPATRDTTFDVPINPWLRDVCSRSVAVGVVTSHKQPKDKKLPQCPVI